MSQNLALTFCLDRTKNDAAQILFMKFMDLMKWRFNTTKWAET